MNACCESEVIAMKKAARDEQLKTARAKGIEVLDGRTPRERGEEKTLAVLDWIYRWTWASPTTAEILGGAQRSGLAARLVKKGYLRSTRTAAGGGERGVPLTILTLTERGLMHIERKRESLLAYEMDPYRVRQNKLRHDQIAQMATAKQLQNGNISGYLSEKEMALCSKRGVKQPDVCWLIGDTKTAIEVELTAKWDRDFDEFVAGCIASLTEKDGVARFNFITIVSDSRAIVSRYRAGFQADSSYGEWVKNDGGKWTKPTTLKVPEWVVTDRRIGSIP